MKISVVIPCFNESNSIAAVVKGVPPEVSEIIVVDNNSTDGSAEIARGAGATVVSETKRGYGAALKRGFEAASGDVIVTIDADNQHPAGAIMPMAELLQRSGAEIIVGSRFLGKRKGYVRLGRAIGNQVLTFLANTLFGLHMTDSQSGMWAFRKSMLDLFLLESDDMALSEEIKIRAARIRPGAFVEYPITEGSRIGTSKLAPIRHGIRNMWHIISLRFRLPSKGIIIERSRTS